MAPCHQLSLCHLAETWNIYSTFLLFKTSWCIYACMSWSSSVYIVVCCWECHNELLFNTLRPRQNGCHFAGDIFKCIFLNENVWIPIKISPKFVPKGPINNIPTLVQIMAWRRPGDKPLSEPMMVSLLRHICVTRPQWVKELGILTVKDFTNIVLLSLCIDSIIISMS